MHVIAPAGPDGRIVRDPGVSTWPIVHGGAFGWPGAASRLKARPWRAAGAAAFAALASTRLPRLRPDRIIAHWIVPSAYPVGASYRSVQTVDAVAHGADVRLILGLPAHVRVQLMTRVLETVTSIRFAAWASRDLLAAGLPDQLRSRLLRRSHIQPAGLSIPDVFSGACDLRAAWGGRPRAVTVSRLVPSKRVDLTIEAARHLHPDISFSVVGDGPDCGRLRGLPGAQSVHFEGRVPHPRALAWIAAADVVLHPSSVEAAPTVIREARILGTPVVACESGDVRRWAQNDAGIVVVAPDSRVIADAVGEMVRFRRPIHRGQVPCPLPKGAGSAGVGPCEHERGHGQCG